MSDALMSRPVPGTVSKVEVHTQADRTLLVRWHLEGDPVPIDVSLGPTPERMDHRHQMTVPAGQTSVKVPLPSHERWFVSVAPHGGGSAVVCADRRVHFQGATNFRDLGGYRTRSGAAVRWGRIFRADSLHGLSPDDLVLYQTLGMRAVFDLRGESERYDRPSAVPSHPLIMIGRTTEEAIKAKRPPTGATAADGERFLYDLYVGMVEHSSEQVGQLFRGLAQDEILPAVFHCHAGKDRTGIVAALLLETLGVDRELVLDDYELTARYRNGTQQWATTLQRLIDSGMSAQLAAGIVATPRWVMQNALEKMDREYGGIESYLQNRAGMRPTDIELLRQRLLDGAGRE
jgi:protein-tyrosine phosphatase